MQLLSSHFDTWRLSPEGRKRRLHYGKISTETFGLTSLQVTPVGCWSKFADTTVLLSWLQSLLASTLLVSTDTIKDLLTATKSINEAFRVLYNGGVWLSAAEARAAGAAGLLFLRMYAGLAASALESGRSRFPITPKAHYLHHAFLDLYNMSSRFPWVPSPIMFSVQIDEDFIGKVSRASRRVGTLKQMERTIGRYKVGAWLAMFDEEGKEGSVLGSVSKPIQPPGIPF